MTSDADKKFSLERKIPLALVWAVVLNLGGGVWWAAATSARLDQIEKADYSKLVERVVAVEVKIDQAAEDFGYNRSQLTELNGKIDKVLARGSKR